MSIKYLDKLSEIESFSLYSADINELAYLLCVEMLYDGQLDIPNAHKFFDVDHRDNEELKRLLNKKIEFYEQTITESIEKGEIKTVFELRDLETGKLIPAQTLISYAEFYKFLSLYDIDEIVGFDEDYPIRQRWEFEADLEYEITEIIARKKSLYFSKWERVLYEKTMQTVKNEPENLESIIKENVDLKIKLALGEGRIVNESKPLINRERETLLIIIAALAKDSGIDITRKSKAAESIALLTQSIGVAVGATTIENHLKRIEDALENRAK